MARGVTLHLEENQTKGGIFPLMPTVMPPLTQNISRPIHQGASLLEGTLAILSIPPDTAPPGSTTDTVVIQTAITFVLTATRHFTDFSPFSDMKESTQITNHVIAQSVEEDLAKKEIYECTNYGTTDKSRTRNRMTMNY